MERKRILIVDDERAVRRLLVWTLEKEGYVVHSAENGLAALRHIEQHDCDLLITDYRMPYMDGLELTKQIRSRFPSIPVLVVSGDGPFHDLIKNGASACVAKPFSACELLDLVRSILGRDK